MPRLVKILISLSFAFIIFNCNKTTGPVLPDVTTSETTLTNLRVNIVSSDSLVIRNGDSLLVKAMDVEKISIFEEHEDSLFFLKTIAPSYKNVGSLLRLEYLLPIKVLYPDYDKSFVLQFNMSDDTIIEVKTYANMYKYPYENVERWFRFTDIGAIDPYGGDSGYLCTPLYTYDFEIIDNNFYFNVGNCEAWGISKYNFITGESEYVSNISGEDRYPENNDPSPLNKPHYAHGVHLAVDGDYLFCDHATVESRIYVVNLRLDSLDCFIDISTPTSGIEAANDILYFIVENEYLSNNYDLRICNYDGELLNNINLPVVGPDNDMFAYNGIELYKGILYIWNRDKILRLNLSDLTFLAPLVSPRYYHDGFDIHDDILYYGWNDIYWLELSELREVE